MESDRLTEERRRARNAYKSAWYARNKERLKREGRVSRPSKEYHREWRRRNRERLREKHLEWRRANPDALKEIRLRRKYGISTDELSALFLAQNGKCAICGKQLDMLAPSLSGLRPNIDHDHRTGKVRGLLCKGCNTSLGVFGDDLVGILRVVDYLVSHG